MDLFASKDTLLRKADALLGEARRSRKQASLAVDDARGPLIERAEDFERQAARLERDAATAKSGVLAPYSPRPGATKGRTA